MRIVVDTNVLVSGLLTPFGPPGVVVAQIVSGSVSLCYDARILTEYADVLRRKAFAFSETSIAALLGAVEANGQLVLPAPLRLRLSDPDDEPFLEIAVASMADYLVTGNVRHFPDCARQGVRIVSPREFVDTGLRSG
jgi:putative PIN family toxin of toxin-antitoxin system